MFESHKERKSEMIDGDDTGYEHFAQRAAVLLANSFKVLTDDSIKKVTNQMVIDFAPLRSQLNQVINRQQEILDQLLVKLTQLETQLTKVQTSQQQTIYSLEGIEKQLERLGVESKLLENASRENRLVGTEHYQDHVIQPMVRSLFPIFDFIEDGINAIPEHSDDSEVRNQELAEGILIQLRQFLSVYEIEAFSHKPRSKFDPRVMRPVKAVPTNNRQLDGRVAKALRAGFRWGGRDCLGPKV